jgi:hypothetical protein
MELKFNYRVNKWNYYKNERLNFFNTFNKSKNRNNDLKKIVTKGLRFRCFVLNLGLKHCRTLLKRQDGNKMFRVWV